MTYVTTTEAMFVTFEYFPRQSRVEENRLQQSRAIPATMTRQSSDECTDNVYIYIAHLSFGRYSKKLTLTSDTLYTEQWVGFQGSAVQLED